MTKRHFIMLAREIAKISDPLARYEAASAVATAAAVFNPRFDRVRFYKACDLYGY